MRFGLRISGPMFVNLINLAELVKRERKGGRGGKVRGKQ